MALIDTLIGLRGGGCAIDMEKALEEVNKAVRATGKKGSITLKLDILPSPKGASAPVETAYVRDHLKVDAPKPDKKMTLFFLSENGQLNTSDTRQMDLLEESSPEGVRQ